MSSRNDLANREVGQDQSFILQAMQQHFMRLEGWMNDMRDWIEQNEEVLRQERRVLTTLNHEEHEDELGDEEGHLVEEVGRFAPQRIRQGRGTQ